MKTSGFIINTTSDIKIGALRYRGARIEPSDLELRNRRAKYYRQLVTNAFHRRTGLVPSASVIDDAHDQEHYGHFDQHTHHGS
jgi:hypothetical protein